MSNAKWTANAIPPQAGKRALVTGANSGIGYQAALELARHGAHVMLACRDAGKGEAAVQRVRREAPGASVEAILLDLASLGSVRAVAEQIEGSGRPLDLLINNAGVMAFPERQLTGDGFERQFGTNHLGHFALTGLLLPALLRAPAPRVVTVASLAHRNGKIELDNLQSERKYVPWVAYQNSKLANLLFAKELDRRARAQRSKLVSIPVHPGVSRTSIVSNGPGAGDLRSKLLFTFGKPLTQDDAMGALPALYAATDPQAQGGEYIGPDGFLEMRGYPKVVTPRPNALDEDAAKKLWQASEQLTGVVYPLLA